MRIRALTPAVFFIGLGLLCADLVVFTVYPAAYARIARNDLGSLRRDWIPTFELGYERDDRSFYERANWLTEARADTELLIGVALCAVFLLGTVLVLRRSRAAQGVLLQCLSVALGVGFARYVAVDWVPMPELRRDVIDLAIVVVALAGAVLVAIQLRFGGVLIVVAALPLVARFLETVLVSFSWVSEPCIVCCGGGDLVFGPIARLPSAMAFPFAAVACSALIAWLALTRQRQHRISHGAWLAALLAGSMVALASFTLHGDVLEPQWDLVQSRFVMQSGTMSTIGNMLLVLSALVLGGVLLSMRTPLLVSKAVAAALLATSLALFPLAAGTLHDVLVPEARQTAYCELTEGYCLSRLWEPEDALRREHSDVLTQRGLVRYEGGWLSQMLDEPDFVVRQLDAVTTLVHVQTTVSPAAVARVLSEHQSNGAKQIEIATVEFEPAGFWLRDAQRAKATRFTLTYADDGVPLASFHHWQDVIDAARRGNQQLRVRLGQ